MRGALRRRRLVAGAATIATTALVLGACTPGSGGGDGADDDGRASTPAGGEIDTDVAAMEEQTLVVWDQEVRGGQNEQMERLNAAFEDEYPNITIERETQSNDDLTATLRLALTGNDAPDVTQANNSRSQMGQYVEGGQLISLEPYAEAYGWTERFPAGVLQNTRYSEDGVTFGEGSLYGLPQVGEVVGVFYSQPKMAELGLEVPETWDEFESQLATIAEAGETPLLLGNLDQWPALHVFGPIQAAHVDPEEIRALGFGNAGASWTTDANVEAAETIAEWAEAGYFNEGFNGADYDAVWQSLVEGAGVYLIGGSWLAADLEAAMGEDVGFFAPPPVEPGEGPVTTGGIGIPFAVTSQAENPDLAAAYIDFITNEAAMAVLAETGNVPVVDTAEHMPESGVLADVYRAYGEVTEDGALVPYLDWATPTMADTLGEALQALMAGRMTPQEFVETLEADYAEFVAASG